MSPVLSGFQRGRSHLYCRDLILDGFVEKVLLDLGLENFEVRGMTKSMSGPGTSRSKGVETRHWGRCCEYGGGDR